MYRSRSWKRPPLVLNSASALSSIGAKSQEPTCRDGHCLWFYSALAIACICLFKSTDCSLDVKALLT